MYTPLNGRDSEIASGSSRAEAVSLGIVLLRSAPAQKARSPAPVRIATHRPGSLSKSSTAARNASLNSGLIEFIACGRLNVIVARLAA